MSNKLKYIIFFGAVFGLLGFAHSIRCSETPIISSLVGWLTISTALYYFTVELMFPDDAIGFQTPREAWVFMGRNEAVPSMVGALMFSALQHLFILTDMYLAESVASALFFVWFYFVLGRSVDG